LIPIIPHFAYEAINAIKQEKEIIWPSYDESLILEEVIPFVIQINGRKRGLIEINRDVSEEEIMNIILKNPGIKKYLENQNIKKKILVKNKLINIII
jgi:leucyl-tRNA synthetase